MAGGGAPRPRRSTARPGAPAPGGGRRQVTSPRTSRRGSGPGRRRDALDDGAAVAKTTSSASAAEKRSRYSFAPTAPAPRRRAASAPRSSAAARGADLHRIPAAEHALSARPRELLVAALGAGRAPGRLPRRSITSNVPCHRSTVTIPPSRASVAARQELQRLRGLDAGHHVDDGRHHARRVAGRAAPGGGSSPSTQRRQGVTRGPHAGPGRRRPRRPRRPRARARRQTSLTRKRVSKLSVPSSTRSCPATSSPTLSAARSATTPRTATSELIGAAGPRPPPPWAGPGPRPTPRRATAAAGSTPRRSRGPPP